MSSGPVFAFVGGGVMGEAMVAALARTGVPLASLRVAESSESRRSALAALFPGLAVFESGAEAARGAEAVVLCVKPQVASSVLSSLSLSSGQLALSIMAGVTLSSLSLLLSGHSAVVRCMPNTAAQVGKSATVFVAPPSLSAAHLALVRRILSSLGEAVVQVTDESMLDRATGVSGSGPAFVFLLLESYIDAAVEMGFTRDQASLLTLQTFDGSLALARASPSLHLAALRNAVTSPGGTTAAGLAAAEERGLRTAVRAAIVAAAAKSEALGKPKL